ncbi:glycosyl hydrolase [Chaetomium tenue]|uniref:Glycosyl hydrolase n=1 Tax=Chaetomium tenue TaxID=1854479 RepID=A0ACB7PH12_9PEZI|nr:glycosyl hydrolase [Chaetomium globosum]
MLGSVLFTALALLGSACAQQSETFTNPVLYEDFPDNDISMGPDGAYYYSASNFHYSPAAPILRSYDLVDWEFVGHSIPRQNFGDGYDLPPTGERAYRGGTWASTLRYRESNKTWYWIGCTNFYLTWVFTAPNPEGPWTQAANYGGGVCFYDNGLLIDDDDTMYVVYTYDGGKQVNVTQLAPDGLSTVRTEKVLEPGQVGVDDVEGNRMYKINGLYYILNDHPGSTAYVWKSTSPWGPYEGKPLADNVQSPLPGGGAPHQGSLIETAQGDWYFMSFTWAFPSGRLPVLAPITWQDDGFPTLVTNTTTGGWGTSYPLPLPRKPLNYTWSETHYPFITLTTLPPTFEWNHNPDTSAYALAPDTGLVLQTATVNTTDDLYSARNTLTHRVHGEFPTATLELDRHQQPPTWEPTSPSDHHHPSSHHHNHHHPPAPAPPQLHRHRPNRILLFPGCFNPPHLAHHALLQQAFTRTQTDLRVVAAMVLPPDDDRLAAKEEQRKWLGERGRGAAKGGVRGQQGGGIGGGDGTADVDADAVSGAVVEGGGLLLTRAQRVALWRGRCPPAGAAGAAGAGVGGGLRGDGWMWVYDRSEEEWHGFRERLVDAAGRDGFELEFVCLLGADYVGRGRVPWGSWDCDGIVVGEVGREVDFVARDADGGRRMLSLAWCEKWEPVGEDEDQQGAGTSMNDTRQRQWMCRGKYGEGQGQWVRYVPCPDDEKTVHTGGSTRIRDMIASCPSGQLLERLEGAAMNPDMLAEFVMDARRASSSKLLVL